MPQPANAYYAVANVSKSAGSVLINFTSVMAHPEYDGQSINNDVALFRTTSEIPLSAEVQPICLARGDTPMDAYKGAKATVMGWGNQNPINGGKYTDRTYLKDLFLEECQADSVHTVGRYSLRGHFFFTFKFIAKTQI